MSWKKFVELNQVPQMYQDVLPEFPQVKNKYGMEFREFIFKFLEQPESVMLFGPSGTGKTYFIYTMIRGLLERRKARLSDIKFFKSNRLDEKALEHFNAYSSTRDLINGLCEVPFLFIDDWGTERTTDRMLNIYYDIVDSRLSNYKPTVFSTNLNEKDIGATYGDRIFSRLKEALWIPFDGPDLRGRKV